MTNQAEGTIRLLICDDQAIVCEGLRAILEPVPQIEVVGVANNGIEAIELTRTTQPDLVLMDLKMPRMNGIRATKEICEQFPDVRVLVLTTYDDDEWVVDAIRCGAAGYLLKDTPQEELVKAIVGTVQGGSHLDPQVAGKILKYVTHQPAPASPDRTLINDLSDREREVLRLLATGLSNAEIAQALFLTDGTVKNYVSTIFSKLDVADRTQAAILAIRAGLVRL
ncbi:MAG: response regulator transcription factor [Anaerolineaceae bacterium]|nr:response regulator transcription factor [Anaerolineaceae bacterium]